MNIYEYIHSLPIEGITEGIDALTVTATGLDGKLSIDLVLYALREQLAAEKVKKFRFQGADGWQRGSVAYADKKDDKQQKLWAILQVKGKSSELALREALKLKDVKFTRIDYCIDVFMSGKVLGLARKLKDTYRGNHAIKLIESSTGDTLYVGSRESESMLRIYDKSSEYGEEQGRVWRFEVEYKKGLASPAAEYLEREGLAGIPDAVWCDCRAKDIPSPIPGKVVRLKRQSVTMSSAEMKLAWLSRSVAPTIFWLKSLNLEQEVRGAVRLGLPID